MKLWLVPNTPIKILLEDYYFNYEGIVVKIPRWYAFDWLSIPNYLQWIVNMNESDNITDWLIHDFCYSLISPRFITRQWADALLFHRLKDTNKKWRAILIYIWVFYFGCFSWKKDYNYKKYKTLINKERKRLWIKLNKSLFIKTRVWENS